MAKTKEPSPYAVWLSEQNFTGHKNKRIVYINMCIGILIGFALGILIF
jgi:hypothetical protein